MPNLTTIAPINTLNSCEISSSEYNNTQSEIEEYLKNSTMFTDGREAFSHFYRWLLQSGGEINIQNNQQFFLINKDALDALHEIQDESNSTILNILSQITTIFKDNPDNFTILPINYYNEIQGIRIVANFDNHTQQNITTEKFSTLKTQVATCIENLYNSSTSTDLDETTTLSKSITGTTSSTIVDEVKKFFTSFIETTTEFAKNFTVEQITNNSANEVHNSTETSELLNITTLNNNSQSNSTSLFSENAYNPTIIQISWGIFTVVPIVFVIGALCFYRFNTNSNNNSTEQERNSLLVAESTPNTATNSVEANQLTNLPELN